MREGILLQGKFECKQDDLLHCLEYDNHPPLQKVMSDVCQAFAKEEAASYHIHLPCFIAHFIYGLFLCPISWVIRKGKGRLVINASTMLTPDDTSAPNSYIPKAGMPGAEDECPPVYFGDALK
jgi:hypothetical protein